MMTSVNVAKTAEMSGLRRYGNVMLRNLTPLRNAQDVRRLVRGVVLVLKHVVEQQKSRREGIEHRTRDDSLETVN